MAQSSGNLTALAHQKIRDAIVYAKLDLGEPLSENELAKALGMSKAPVRGAISELRLQGLVTVIPQSGSYVFSPSVAEIKELCDFRFFLEERGMRLAMEAGGADFVGELSMIVEDMKASLSESDFIRYKACDSAFHKAFIKYSNNRFLKASYESVMYKVEALRYRYMNTPIFRNKGINEHKRICDLLRQGNVSSASKILWAHISRTKEMQSGIEWGADKLNRNYYKDRDYDSIF